MRGPVSVIGFLGFLAGMICLMMVLLLSIGNEDMLFSLRIAVGGGMLTSVGLLALVFDTPIPVHKH